MTDDTTNPRETPDPSAPPPSESQAPDSESTQVLGQNEPTSELPSLEIPEQTAMPEQTEAHESTEATETLEAAPAVVPSPPTTLATPVAPVAPAAPASPAAAPGGLVTVRTGPRPGAILLGLLCLLVSAYTTARQTLDWRLDLNLVGPVTIGAMGALLLLVGLIGLVSRRRS